MHWFYSSLTICYNKARLDQTWWLIPADEIFYVCEASAHQHARVATWSKGTHSARGDSLTAVVFVAAAFLLLFLTVSGHLFLRTKPLADSTWHHFRSVDVPPKTSISNTTVLFSDWIVTTLSYCNRLHSWGYFLRRKTIQANSTFSSNFSIDYVSMIQHQK